MLPRGPRHHLLYRPPPPASAAAGVSRHLIREIRTSRGGPGDGARTRPNNIHVVHLLIDAGVDSEAIHQRMKARGIEASAIPPHSLTKTSSIAEAYWSRISKPATAGPMNSISAHRGEM